MGYEFYISPTHYQVAEQNGISKGTLEQRVWKLAWPMERAITNPVRRQIDHKELAELAERNGIRYPTFTSRINKHGWDPIRAATSPLIDRHKAMAIVGKGRRKYSVEHIEKAKSNGIAYSTMRGRIREGWNIEDACTIPTMTKSQITRIVKNEYGIATRKLREPHTKHVVKEGVKV